MRDNDSAPATSQSQSPSTADLVPRLLRSLSKTQQVIESGAGTQQTGLRWMSKQKATAIGHFTKLTHRGRTPAQVGVATDNDADPVGWSSQTLHVVRTPIDNRKNDGNVNSAADGPGESPEPIFLNAFAKRMQDMFSTIPSFASSISPGSTPAPQTEADGGPSPVRDPHLLEHGWQSFCSALDRLRLPSGRKHEATSASEPLQDDILDCIDDNNSVMMYGPLEPDDTSEVEIACSEIVSINGDGEEIRTPQPRFIPLPTESDESLMGCGPRSPPPRFVPLPLESIDQVLMGGDGEVSSVRWKESEAGIIPEATSATQVPPITEPGADKPPVKEYRVWLPSLTKLSVQTMWWGFRIYLPPPVLDVLNNRQLEAAKRAALITTALQWLMDHLPVSLLPPQMRPGVAILRHLSPYVGYMGGFIAWGWSAIRSFDKGYGVVLTATWLLPFVLIPGSWEADEVPNLNTDPQPSPSVSS